MEATKPFSQKLGLTAKILIAMGTGITIGIILNLLPSSPHVNVYLIDGIFDIGGKIFITLLKMLVVPIVFVSLVCGTCNLGGTQKFGRLAVKTLILYIFTTAVAISLALIIAKLIGVGSDGPSIAVSQFQVHEIPSLKQTFIKIFPSNPFAALAKGDMLQVIVFSIFLGLAINLAGKKGESIAKLFKDLDAVVMHLMTIIIHIAPYGVFCLVAAMFAKVGFGLIFQLITYFMAVVLVLMVQLFVTYPLLLKFLADLNPIVFFKKLFPAMLFAFSTSSSNASIPVVLNTVEMKLGVRNVIAAFIIPLGATINMDGTAIMQGVATVFIAHTYNIDIGLTGYLTVILTATLASIGTAGVPGVGLITLTMVLQQVGLPVEGIALIIGVDRLLDMTRTAVNITGDSTVACIVGRSEKALDLAVYNKPYVESELDE